MNYTLNEKGLIEWLLRSEAKHCKMQLLRTDLSDTWKEDYQRRLDCAKSALEKTTSEEGR